MTIRVGFVGLSHLGMVSSIFWASLGWEIVEVDNDASRVSALSEGRLPIHEPGLPELLTECRARLEFSIDFSRLFDCDIVCVALDTDTDHAALADRMRGNYIIDCMNVLGRAVTTEHGCRYIAVGGPDG